MDAKEKVFKDLRKRNLRITKPRKAIIEVLDGKHLTLQEIYVGLKEKGYSNLGTVYNNIEFLLDNKVITQVFINGKKHYDLTIDETSHTADSHIHITCKVNNNIIEINESEIFDLIKKQPVFDHFVIEKIQIVAQGYCKYHNTANCQDDEHCYIRKLLKKQDDL